MSFIRKYRLSARASWLVIGAIIIFARLQFPPRALNTTGVIAIPDITLTVIFWLLLCLVHHCLGASSLKLMFGEKGYGRIASALALPLGFGLSGSVLGGLGLIGALNPAIIHSYVLFLLALLGPQFGPAIRNMLAPLKSKILEPSGFARIAKIAVIIIASLSFVNSLVPPWSYDGLMYHLPGPTDFLAAGKIRANTDNWYVNGPFLVEMLFTFGLALKDDIVPKLIHWSFGFSFIGICYAYARHSFDEKTGWFAVLILLSVPIIPILSGFAYIDLAWATFEFSAIAALLCWEQSDQDRWLYVSGLMIGFALSSKYLGLMGLATAGIFFTYLQFREFNSRSILQNLIRFSVPILIFGSPWYLKNMILFGNPVYPLYFGGPGWDANRLDLYMSYLNQFGTGRNWKDFVALPWNIYIRHEEFGAVFNRNDIPSLLFPLVALIVFLPRRRRAMSLLYVALLRFGFWLIGSHQIRFLLPIYPPLSILSAYTVKQLVQQFKSNKLLEFFFQTLVVGLTLITIFYQVQILRTFNTLAVIGGFDSKATFLRNASRDFAAKEYLRESGPIDGKLLLLGNGRYYYCQSFCTPDPDHFRWSYALSQLSSASDTRNWFKQKKFSHLLISAEDIGFLMDHDPYEILPRALEVLDDYRQEGCLKTIFSDQNNTLFENTCY